MFTGDFKNASNLSVAQEPTIEYEYTENFVHISSVDRDAVAYPQPQQYRIPFDNVFKNVCSVEIINAVIPKQGNVDLEPYLVLQVDELPNVCMGQSKNAPKDAFAVLYLESGVGNFLTVKSNNCDKLVKTYKNPLASLDRITIRILDNLGSPFDFGTDAVFPTTPTKSLQNSFLFKIVTLEKKRDALKPRSVFY